MVELSVLLYDSSKINPNLDVFLPERNYVPLTIRRDITGNRGACHIYRDVIEIVENILGERLTVKDKLLLVEMASIASKHFKSYRRKYGYAVAYVIVKTRFPHRVHDLIQQYLRERGRRGKKEKSLMGIVLRLGLGNYVRNVDAWREVFYYIEEWFRENNNVREKLYPLVSALVMVYRRNGGFVYTAPRIMAAGFIRVASMLLGDPVPQRCFNWWKKKTSISALSICERKIMDTCGIRYRIENTGPVIEYVPQDIKAITELAKKK